MSQRNKSAIKKSCIAHFVAAVNGLELDAGALLFRVKRQHRSFAVKSGQSGIALVVAMILLIVITLVGLAAVRGTIMQQKMTANFYDRQLAFQAAEAALRQGEAAIQLITPPGSYRNCSPTATPLINCPADPFSNAATLPTNPSPIVSVPGTTFAQGALLGGTGTLSAGSQPQYVIEYMGHFAVPPPKVKQISNGPGGYQANQTTYADFYRITAQSSNASQVTDRAVVTLQSIYKR